MTLTTNQRLVNNSLARKMKQLRWSNKVSDQMLQLLMRSRPEIQAALLKAIGNKGRPDVGAAQLNRLLATVRSTVGDVYGGIYGNLERQLAQFAKDEARFSSAMLSAAIPAEVLAVVAVGSVAPTQVAAAALARPFQGYLLREWAEQQAESMVHMVANVVRRGYRQGTPTEGIIADLNFKLPGQNLQAVTRTAVSHYAAVAREMTADANADIVKGEQWLSTLDGHTSTMCIVRDRLVYRRAADGKMTPVGHAVPWGAGPGRLHFCCRSTSTMITKSLDELGIKNASNETRASMNGQVPASQTFSEWIVEQNAKTLEDAFGVERAWLIRQGKVSVPDLFTDDGRYLTLDQLRQHIPE